MQPSDQDSTEKIDQEHREEGASPDTRASDTFTSDDENARFESNPAPGTRVLPEASREQRISAVELVAPGVYYPPPPEFYEQMPAVSEKKFQLPVLPPKPPQPLPVAQPSWSSSAPVSEVDPWNQPRAFSPSPLPGIPNQTSYRAPTVGYPPPYQGQRSVRRRPNKWVWIMGGVLGLILLSSCALVVWSVSNWVSPAVQQLFDGVQTVNNYYDALEAKNYVAAYRMLALDGKQNGLSQAQFIQQAQAQDRQNGEITAYSVGQPTVGTNNSDTGTNVSEFSVVVNVTRGKQQYNANLHLKLIGGSWKIIGYDRL